MDDTSDPLELELKALRPARPSGDLATRLARELSLPSVPPAAPRYTTATNLASWKWAGWRLPAVAATAAACAFAVLWTWRQPAEPPATLALAPTLPTATHRASAATAAPSAATRFQPGTASPVLFAVEAAGFGLLPDETPARRVRNRYVDTYTWRNPATNASLKWSVPRDEVRVLPTLFQ